MISVSTVACNNCGAPLQINDGINFVTCGYCGASLSVNRSGGVVYTQVLNQIAQNTSSIVHNTSQIAQNTASIDSNLRMMRVQNAVETLDSHWDWQRAKYLLEINAAKQLAEEARLDIRNHFWLSHDWQNARLTYKIARFMVKQEEARYVRDEQAYLAERDSLLRS